MGLDTAALVDLRLASGAHVWSAQLSTPAEADSRVFWGSDGVRSIVVAACKAAASAGSALQAVELVVQRGGQPEDHVQRGERHRRHGAAGPGEGVECTM